MRTASKTHIVGTTKRNLKERCQFENIGRRIRMRDARLIVKKRRGKCR